jgi:phosphoglycolate phosphatase-like HAD superfamily hydrolase
MRPKVLIFDFDGVICDSVHVKTDAFVELYRDYSFAVQNEVKKYHLQNGGISRFEKIKYFQSELLGLPASEESVKVIADRFAGLVKEKVIVSPFINGAKEFLEKHANDCLQFICTGTPEFEIIEIIERRGLTNLFESLYGSPKTKTEIIHKILNDTRCTPDECIFLGDAMTDYKAAIACNIPFIGIMNNDTFFPDGTQLIVDFNDPKLEIFDL